MRSITDARAEAFTIGGLSDLTAVNIETIRYYERIKMLPVWRSRRSGRPAATLLFRRRREFRVPEVASHL